MVKNNFKLFEILDSKTTPETREFNLLEDYLLLEQNCRQFSSNIKQKFRIVKFCI